MPWNRKLYPHNWEAIAHVIKEEAHWTCQECGRPCRQPGESDWDLSDRLDRDHPQWSAELFEMVYDDELGEVERMKPGRFTLTVAHLDHRPQNCARSNLKALCAPCHCRYDLKAMPTKRQLKRERHGQLRLPL